MYKYLFCLALNIKTAMHVSITMLHKSARDILHGWLSRPRVRKTNKHNTVLSYTNISENQVLKRRKIILMFPFGQMKAAAEAAGETYTPKVPSPVD